VRGIVRGKKRERIQEKRKKEKRKEKRKKEKERKKGKEFEIANEMKILKFKLNIS
jgi:hypothetical protein